MQSTRFEQCVCDHGELSLDVWRGYGLFVDGRDHNRGSSRTGMLYAFRVTESGQWMGSAVS